MKYRVEWVPYLDYLRNVMKIDVLRDDKQSFREALRFARDGWSTEWRIIRLSDGKTVAQTKGWRQSGVGE